MIEEMSVDDQNNWRHDQPMFFFSVFDSDVWVSLCRMMNVLGWKDQQDFVKPVVVRGSVWK